MGAKLYEVTFPDAHREKIVNLREFCIKYDLDQGHMCKVAQGKRSHHKGFLVKIIDANNNTRPELRLKEKRQKIIAVCEETTQTPINQLTQRQKDDLIYTLYALEKIYSV